MSTLVWFRRDLRIHDHPALWAARSEGTVFGLFVLDPRILGASTTGPRRVRFLLESLRELGERLDELGVPLLVREGPPEHWVPEVARDLGVRSVLAVADFTPYAFRRDARTAAALRTAGVRLEFHGSVLLTDAGWTSEGSPRRVPSFSALARRHWPRSVGEPLPPPCSQARPSVGSDPVPPPSRFGADVPLPMEAGESAARVRLERFAAERLVQYPAARNSLDPDATSGLSQDLHFGLLSAREVASRCPSPPFVRQLLWREYAHYVLQHRPDLRSRAYRAEFERIPWIRDREAFRRWQEGRTGYPLVDAAMRQLAATGRMANRLRMLTASFLTKHLLIDWRWGMAHFLRELVDGDVANNTFGWQWAASLGVDAASPFRIFSPDRHSERFDPSGRFVRRWIPELEAEPSRYPAPIVDHREAVGRAREVWRAARSTEERT